MANTRIAIRQAVQAMLSGNTDAKLSVFTNRADKLWGSELPAILISTGTEEAAPESLRAQRYIRTVELLITLKCEIDSGDEIDSFAGEVEDLIIQSPDLSGSVLSTTLIKTETTLYDGSETDKAEAVLTFQCKYIA